MLLFCSICAGEDRREPLWPEGAPDAKGTSEDDTPTLTIYRPAANAATGAAVIVCPGGGYGHLAVVHEGVDIAIWLNSIGVTAAVLEYRHQNRGYGHPAPLHDAQRAIRTIRSRAGDMDIDPGRIGILGFSAGGHLASTAATHFDHGDPGASDPVERISCRPDFAVLCYAVIAFDEPYSHKGSQRNLIGEDAPVELIRNLSNEKQVTAETPPTFLFHTDEDTAVPAENSVNFYLALRRAGVPGELHVYRSGRHGIGLGRDIPGTADWSQTCERWMMGLGLLTR
jgi:acetyl esterase/lipase